MNAEPVTGLVVEIGGSLNGIPVQALGITGGATMLGPGGYEITLGNRPVASEGALWIQLYDVDGTPLSNKIIINTFGNCERNLILVNFSEVTSTTSLSYYFPFAAPEDRTITFLSSAAEDGTITFLSSDSDRGAEWPISIILGSLPHSMNA
jgi:hypothetical protein